MQPSLTSFKNDFTRRLSASLGAAEALRTEKWIGVTRVFLALYCYIWAQLGSSDSVFQPWQSLTFLKVYFLYSVLILVLLHLHRATETPYLLTTLAIDFLFAGTISALTGGLESPYAPLCIFATATTAYRWGLRQVILSSFSCTLLIIVESAALKFLRGSSPALAGREFLVFSLRLAGLLSVTLLIGLLILRERLLRAQSAAVARVLERARAGSTLHPALETLFSELHTLFAPRKMLIALRVGTDEEVFFAQGASSSNRSQVGVVKTILQFSKLESAIFSCPAHSWYLKTALPNSGRASNLLAFDAAGKRMQSLEFDLEPWNQPDNEFGSLIVSAFRFEGSLEGRLILFDPSIRWGRKESLRFLRKLLKQTGPALQNIYILRDITKQLENKVRAELSRELHDGILQSLLSAEMQVEVLRRTLSAQSNESEQRIIRLQALIHQEALDLRDLIEKTKPLNFVPRELPDFLAEVVGRFRFETGISVRLETSEKVLLPFNACHEIVRIVQEGLSNIRKHSGAQNVLITLREKPEGQCELQIGDDGRGFEFRGRVTLPQLDAAHRGPSVIKERVRLIGGEMTIDSSPGNWARLEITIPDNLYG
jgi:signal transduction histidine kinase